MSHLIDIGILSHARPFRTEMLLETLRRYTETEDFGVLVSEDLSVPPGSGRPRMTEHAAKVSESFRVMARQYGARHVVSDRRIGLQGNYRQVVENTTAPFIVLCSDDILFTKGAMDCLVNFISDNFDKLDKVAGFHVLNFHASTPETDDLRDMGFIKNLSDFYSKPCWLHRYDGVLPEHPQNSLGICSGFHGSIGVVSRKYWDLVGGCSQDHWVADQSLCLRIMLQTDGFFLRIPMPTIAHFGAASFFYGEAFPQGNPSNDNHRSQLEVLCQEHGEAIEGKDQELKAARRLSERADELARQRTRENEEWLRFLSIGVQPTT